VFVLVSGPPAAKGWPAPQFFAADAIKGPSWTGRVRLANIEEAVAEARGMGAISRRFTRAKASAHLRQVSHAARVVVQADQKALRGVGQI